MAMMTLRLNRIARGGRERRARLGIELGRRCRRRFATRQQRDALGRVLPWWQGCRVLRREQVLLLMDSADSFHGRHFGVSEGVDLIGKARLL
jgi:hypothetical protein